MKPKHHPGLQTNWAWPSLSVATFPAIR